MKQSKAIDLVVLEYERATKLFGPFASRHEGYAILLEEMDELKEVVWKNQPDERLEEEVKQVAAMAVRFLIDCIKEEE